jgi:hypothetical protein
MWKTPGCFWAQIGPFTHILQPKTADIHCAAVDLPLFRKPYLAMVLQGLHAAGGILRGYQQPFQLQAA